MSLIIATESGLSSVEFPSGNLIKSYKQCDSVKNGLCVGYSSSSTKPVSIMAIQKDKPLIHHYAGKKESVNKRIVLPSKMEALAISPNGQWLAAGSKEGTLYVWDLWSGSLQTLFGEAHFQAIKCLTWSKDSSVLVSGGDDARILVWRTIDLVANEGTAPKHTFTTHSLPVTSCVVGFGTFREARLYTASTDATVCTFDLYSGKLLYTLASDTPIHSLAIDSAERAIYIGGTGGVHAVPLYYEPSDSARLTSVGSATGGVISTNEFERIYKTSEGLRVTALTLTTDCSHLISGLSDGTVACWEVGSGQLVKNLRSTKGSVTDLLMVDGDFAAVEEFEILPMLQRNLSTKQDFIDFVPHGTLEEFNAEELNAVDQQELDDIKASVATTTDTDEIEMDEESGRDADGDNESRLARELKELQERHAQLKKMYDALWAKRSNK